MSLNKNILVTGGAGYIGSHTVVALIEAGFNPYILDDFRNSEVSVIERIAQITGKQVPFFNVDICDSNKIHDALRGIEFSGVIHFAAYKAVGESVSEPLKYYQNNVTGLITLVDWCIKNEVYNFVFSSSCTVYGEPKNEKAVSEESTTGMANSPYGQTKVIGEQLLTDVFRSSEKFKILNLRYFNPIGAHPSSLIGELPIGKPTNLLPFVTQTAVGLINELTVFGDDYPTPDGTCLRDYIHVMDLADAHVKGILFLVSKDQKCLEAINVGTGKASSTLEVIKTFEEISGQKLNWKFGPRRPGDVVEIYAKAQKANDLLGWNAKFSLKDAIKDAWNWELNRKNEN